MSRTLLLLAAAGVFLVGCGPHQLTPTERASQEQMLKDRFSTWARAWSNRDQDSVSMLYDHTGDLTVAWPDGSRERGWDEQTKALTGFFGQVMSYNFVVQDPETSLIDPSVAITTFRYSADVVHNDTRRDVYSGQGTLVWAKDASDGLWKIRAEELSRAPTGQ
ncbi:MAG TPA: nuclear transport factor 2 family protein [Gemmatimonadales bacterium]|nr:nuclear transport factor 2 family protein [Gemmatimonadales bacterium]